MKRDSTAYAETRPTWDGKDCSVRALAVALDAPYEQASAVLSAAGRSLRKGTSVLTTERVHEDWLGMRRVRDVEGWPLAAFCLVHPKGRYVLHKTGHAFAVVDGVLHDWQGTTKAATRIVRAWEVTEQALAKMQAARKLFEGVI